MKKDDKNMKMIYLIRIFHTIATMILLASVAYMYYSAITLTFNNILLIAMILFMIEAGFLILTKNKCPLENLHKIFLDDKGFWDLFMPKKWVPTFFFWLEIISIIGFFSVIFLFIITRFLV